MKKTIAIFYKEYHISERFAYKTKAQLKESGIDINLELVNLRKETHMEFMSSMKKKRTVPDIIYFWESESFGEEPLTLSVFSAKGFLTMLYQDTTFLTYSDEDRIEIERTDENGTIYEYRLFERIKKDVVDLYVKLNFYFVNKEKLELEKYQDKDNFWAERFLFLHSDYVMVNNEGEGRFLIKTIAEERINCLSKEIDSLEKQMKEKDNEISNIKTIIRNL